VTSTRTAVVAATTVLALAGAACGNGSDEQPSAAPGITAAGTTGTGIEWSSCGERLECTKVPVRLDRATEG
jgi:hypothetical protein